MKKFAQPSKIHGFNGAIQHTFKHYRDQVSPEDLLDIKLMQESYTFLDELTQLLDLGAIYNFQKN